MQTSLPSRPRNTSVRSTAVDVDADGEIVAEDEVTRLLNQATGNDPEARRRLFELLHRELRRLAGRLMANQPASHTLQPTALVNELYLRLFGKYGMSWTSRKHFFLSASKAMRNLLVDHARKRNAAKRDGKRVELHESLLLDDYESRCSDLEAFDAALFKLAKEKPQMAEAVELQIFGNITQEETAQLVGMSLRSFQREWAIVRRWLYQELA